MNLDENGGLIDYRNNWCASQMARDATTGNLVWAFNITPADTWDFDEPLITPLIDAEINGQMRQLAIKAARNGYFFVWDRPTGELVDRAVAARLRRPPSPATTWRPAGAMMNIDAWHFTNVEDRRRYTQADPGRSADGTTVADYTGTEVHVCPGIAARNWQNDAYSPRTGLLYTSTYSQLPHPGRDRGRVHPGRRLHAAAWRRRPRSRGPIRITRPPTTAS